MKQRRFDHIEDAFNRGLSDDKMQESLELDLPDLWPDIEEQLGDSQSSFKKWTILLVCLILVVGGTIGLVLNKTDHQSTSILAIENAVPPDFFQSPGSVDAHTHISKEEENLHPSVSRLEQPIQRIGMEQSTAEAKIEATPTQEARLVSVANQAADGLNQLNEMDRNFKVETSKITGTQPQEPRFEILESLDWRPVEGLSWQALSSGLKIFNTSKYWTIRAGFGARSNDYFIQGNFSIDPNTRFEVGNQWSPSFQIEASYFMGRNVSLDFGIQYSPIKTLSRYQFNIPYSGAEEMIDQNRGRIALSHNVPSVGGGLVAESILERNVDDQVREGELIRLDADVEETLQILTLPVSSTLRLYSTGNFQVAARLGVALNVQISELKSEVVSLRSNNEKVRYSAFNVEPLENEGKRTLYAGYQFGLDARWYLNEDGIFLNGSINYANAFTPGFSFDAVDVYPRSWGIEVGIGKSLSRN